MQEINLKEQQVEKELSEQEKGFTSFILDEGMNIIKIIKSLEDSSVSVDGILKQQNMKYRKADFFLLCSHL